MAVLLTTVQTVTINDLGERTFTHPLVNYDLTTDSEYTYEEIRSSDDLGAKLDAGTVTIKNNGNVVADSSELKQVQPQPDPSGSGSSFADIWAANTLINC